MAGRKARKVRMTPAWCEAVKPEAGLVEWRDAGHLGWSLRVYESGKRFLWVRYTFAGRDRRSRLGPFPAVTLKAAPEPARGMLGLAARGTDPQLERERLRVGEYVSAAVATWLDDQKQGPCARWKGDLDDHDRVAFRRGVERLNRASHRRLVEPSSTRLPLNPSLVPASQTTANRIPRDLQLPGYPLGTPSHLVESVS